MSHLQEVEVRLTLRELCGPWLDDCPFGGEVEQNSFRFRAKNCGRGVNPVIVAQFASHNGGTKITISAERTTFDQVTYIVFALFVLVSCLVVFVTLLMNLSAEMIILTAKLVGVFALIFGVDHCVFLFIFRRSLAKIKKALEIEGRSGG